MHGCADVFVDVIDLRPSVVVYIMPAIFSYSKTASLSNESRRAHNFSPMASNLVIIVSDFANFEHPDTFAPRGEVRLVKQASTFVLQEPVSKNQLYRIGNMLKRLTN